MVNFLELVPRANTEALTLETANGPIDVDLTGIGLATLADIAKRFPSFSRFVDGNASGSVFAAAEALPALVAAGLGHPGSAQYEEKIGQFATSDIMKMATTVMRLTFPSPPEEDAARPLPRAADGANALPAVSLPPPLSN
jgi:hypothetical protein